MYKTIQFLFRMNQITKDRLDFLSKEWQMSKSEVIRKLIMDSSS